MVSFGTRSWALAAALALCACAESTEPDGVVEVQYGPTTVERRIRRRIDLLRAGVRLRDEMAVARVTRTAMGYTLICRQPDDGVESGVTGLRPRRRGVPLSRGGQGISRRGGLGVCDLRPEYWLVDVFSSVDAYLTSAAAPREMPGRQVLQHLGLARELSPQADRVLLSADERVYWRQLLPVIVANDGLGPLYLPASQEEADDEPDTLRVLGRRYQLERMDGYVLVGLDTPGERYRHVFTEGGTYLMSLVLYGSPAVGPADMLRALGLEPEAAETEEGSR